MTTTGTSAALSGPGSCVNGHRTGSFVFVGLELGLADPATELVPLEHPVSSKAVTTRETPMRELIFT
ncbi:MAG: hypothetical protein WCQ11_07850, partial [Actinomycetes bacterium]